MMPGKLFPGGAGKFPMAPKLPEMLPLPFVGAVAGNEDIEEYVTVNATAKLSPTTALMSFQPDRMSASTARNTTDKLNLIRALRLIADTTYLPSNRLLG